jgi:hypothetical protein
MVYIRILLASTLFQRASQDIKSFYAMDWELINFPNWNNGTRVIQRRNVEVIKSLALFYHKRFFVTSRGGQVKMGHQGQQFSDRFACFCLAIKLPQNGDPDEQIPKI